MTTPYRIAIIGCGKIARRHLAACLRTSGVEVCAVVDPEVSRAVALVKSAGLRTVAAESLERISIPIDGAIIASPNHTHAELAVDCLRRGISVLIEKPLATTVTEGEAICRTAREAGLVAAVGYATRFRHDVLLMKYLLEKDYFGDIRRFAYQCGTRGGWSPVSSYTLSRRAVGGGVLVVTGSHFLDRMLHWFGQPHEVRLRHDGIDGPEANAFATFSCNFAGRELQGEARFSKTTTMAPGLALDTEAGLVLVSDSDRASIRLRPVEHPEIEVVVERPVTNHDEHKDIFQHQLEDFVAACANRAVSRVSAEDGLESLKLIERLYCSAALIEIDAADVEPVPSLLRS